MMGLVTLFYIGAIWVVSRNFPLALFFGFVATLPFTKGKSFSFLLLPKQFVRLYIQQDIIIFFSLYFSDVLLALFLYFFISRNVRLTGRKKPLMLISVFVLFLCFSFISSCYAIYPTVSFLAWGEFVKLGIILLVPMVVWKDAIGVYWQLICAGVLYEGFFGIMQYINHGRLGRFIESIPVGLLYGKTAWEQQGLLRVSGTFSDPDLYATFLLVNIGVLCGYLLFHEIKEHRGRILLFVSICIGSCAILFSGNRIIYIYLAILLVWFFIRMCMRSMVWKKMGLRYTVVGSLIVVFVGFPYLATRLHGLSRVFAGDGSGTFRLQMIRDAYRVGLSHPLGVGLGMMPYYFATQFTQDHPIYGPDFPHNLFMELFAESGLFGLLFFLLFLYLLYRQVVLGRSVRDSIPFYIGSGLFFLCAMVYPLTFDAIEVISLAFLYMGFAMASDSDHI